MPTYIVDNRAAPIDFECPYDFVARTLQNTKNLLMTRLGEVPYDRFRGFNWALYDMPLPLMREELMPELDRMLLWEPDVEVESAECYLNSDGETIIEMTVEVGGDDEGG